MKIIIVVILSIYLYPPLTTQDNTVAKKQVICNLAGRIWKSTYVFDICQLPERCDIIDVGQFAFDRDNGVDTHVMESDKGIIRTLTAANKLVYTRIGFQSGDDWPSILDPPDATVFQKTSFDPLINFLNTFKINGLLLNFSSMYDIAITDLAKKISDFVSAVKNKVHNLVVGITFSGSSYANFADASLFDFTITNKVLDLYIIDWSALNCCDNTTVKTGASPVTSTNPNITTIETVTCAVTNSKMDKSKIFAMVQVVPIMPLGLLSKDATYSITTYTVYCSSTDKANSSQWCTNPSQLSFDQGAHAQQFYAGIVIDQLDTDDYECKCECGLFPVTNIILDGWSKGTLKQCPKLDQN